jgi:hypothetical protein
MLRNKFLLIGLAAASLAFAIQPAGAQAPRTWVSGIGDDANPCSRLAPCKTFAGAISKTAAGGEISALDPGGFGAVTITKAITIDGGGGQVASVLASGTNGIVVSAGAGHTVTLRNLRINGVSGTPTGGLNGVQFLSGAALHIENCTIFGFTQNAININTTSASATSVFLTDTVVSNSTTGIFARNAGSGLVFVSLQRTTLTQNTFFGLKVDGSAGSGTIVGAVSESLIAGNGVGMSAVSGATSTVGIRVTKSSIVNNVTTGALSDGSAGQPVAILFSDNLITGNSPGLSSVGGGFLFSHQNNSLVGNFPDGAFTGVLPLQ